MADTTNISNLRINILTEEQLQEAIANELVSPDEFYFTPDDGDSKNETVTFTEAGTRTNITTSFDYSAVYVYGIEIIVNYSLPALTISASAGSGGSINPSGNVSVSSGGSQAFTITPNTGYEIDTLKVNGSNVTKTTSYTFTNVTSNQSIAVTFKQSFNPAFAGAAMRQWHFGGKGGGQMTNLDLVNFVKTAKDKPVMYMWGDYGRAITAATIAAKAKQYPTHYTTAYQNELTAKIGKGGIGCDCTGLIKWFLWTQGDISAKVVYNAATDKAASGWYTAAKVRGAIGTLPKDRQGLIVSMSGHCGVYIGDGRVIECTKGKFGNGVVETKLTDRKWEKWCECKWIDYTDEIPTDGQETALSGKSATVVKDCPTYSKLNKKQLPIGMVYQGETVTYLCDHGDMAAIIYQTSATEKIAFVDKAMIVL